MTNIVVDECLELYSYDIAVQYSPTVLPLSHLWCIRVVYANETLPLDLGVVICPWVWHHQSILTGSD